MREKRYPGGKPLVRVRSERMITNAICLGLLAGLVVALIMSALITAARAHDWYPVSCCSDKDCYETGQIEPDPKAVEGGWRLSDGTLVPYGEARVSPDGKFHVCRRSGNGALIEAGKACLWVPGQVS